MAFKTKIEYRIVKSVENLYARSQEEDRQIKVTNDTTKKNEQKFLWRTTWQKSQWNSKKNTSIKWDFTPRTMTAQLFKETRVGRAKLLPLKSFPVNVGWCSNTWHMVGWVVADEGIRDYIINVRSSLAFSTRLTPSRQVHGRKSSPGRNLYDSL